MRNHTVQLSDNQIRVIMHALMELDLPTYSTVIDALLESDLHLDHTDPDVDSFLPLNLHGMFEDTIACEDDGRCLHSFII